MKYQNCTIEILINKNKGNLEIGLIFVGQYERLQNYRN